MEKLELLNEAEASELLYYRCATDKQLFANTFFSHYCSLPFSKLHHDQFTDTDFMARAIRSARAAPRGYAKSTLEALVEPLHDVCYGFEKYIVILSNTEAQAAQKLRDIRGEVLTNDDLVNFYGIHFRTKKPGETQFRIYCGNDSCLFTGYGAGAEIRGIRDKQHRPTKIICDDIEHSEEVNNESIRTKYQDWFREVVSKIGTKDTNIKVIGTILHPDSLLKNLTRNPSYQSKIYKAVISWATNKTLWDQWQKLYTNIDDADRKARSTEFFNQNKDAMMVGVDVLWPEKESYLDLMKELVETGKRAFMKEKQNEPMSSEDSIFEKLYYYREVSEGFLIEHNQLLIPWSQLKDKQGNWLSSFGALDPATGQTRPRVGKSGDYSCLLTGIKDHKERLFVHRDWTKRVAPTKFISEIFEHHLEFQYQKFGVETNLYRNLLMPNILAERRRIEEREKKEIRISFYDIENIENKEKRIYTLEPKTTHGWILFNRELSHEFFNQMSAFPHGDHDDCPDTLELLWGLVNNRYKACAVETGAIGGR